MIYKRVFRFLPAVLLITGWALCQSASAPPTRRVVVRAGHVLDVKTGNMLSGQAIVIEGDRIVSMGPEVDAKIQTGTTTIDLPNATVLPGLIDAHTHLTFDPTTLGYEGLGISYPREALVGAQRTGHAAGRIYHHSERGCARLQRYRASGRD